MGFESMRLIRTTLFNTLPDFYEYVPTFEQAYSGMGLYEFYTNKWKYTLWYS